MFMLARPNTMYIKVQPKFTDNRKETKMKFEYIIKGLARALGEAFCFNIVLPLWYLLIKITERNDV